MRVVSELRPDESLLFKARILESIGEPVIVTDAQGTIIYFGPAAETVYGWSAEDALNRSILDVTVPELSREEADAIMEHLRQQRKWSGEFVVRRRDGTTFPAWVTDTAIADEQGKTIAIVGVSKDVSAVREAQGARNRTLGRDLGRRVNELTALHSAAAILREAAADDAGRHALLRRLAELLPRAFQHPEATAARVRVGNFEATTEGFASSAHSLKADFVTADGELGVVEIVFKGTGPTGADMSFLAEERSLVATFAEMLHADHDRRQMETALRERAAELRAHAARLNAVREEEAKRIAREIHDQVGQALTALKLEIALLEIESARGEERERERGLAARVRTMNEAVDAALQIASKLCKELRPPVLDNLGLVAAVEWATREFEARTGIFCNLRLPNEWLPVESARATAVFRIFQEILTNVIRHADATEVTITLAATRESVRLEVHDNGRGFDPAAPRSDSRLGVVGMRERALEVGGRVELNAAIGRGTTVIAEIPNG